MVDIAAVLGKSRAHKKNQMALASHLIEPAVAGGGSLGALLLVLVVVIQDNSRAKNNLQPQANAIHEFMSFMLLI